MPDQLKIAQVIHTFKTDNPRQFSNYSPISILSVFSKIVKKVVHTRRLNYLDKFSILSVQYSFRRDHSTYMTLIELVYSIDNKEFGMGVFIDLSKDFDTVPIMKFV